MLTLDSRTDPTYASDNAFSRVRRQTRYDDYDYDEYGETYEAPPQSTQPLAREKPMPVSQGVSTRQSEWQEEEYEEYVEEYDDYSEDDDYTDSENYHVDEDGVEWWKDEVDVWWYRYPDEEEWSEFIE